MKNNKKTLKSEQKNQKNLIKGTRGITLIALVITVIVMLILAGVAISVLTDDGGIFEKTRGAAEAYQNAAEREADQLNTLMNEVDQYLAGIPTSKPATKPTTKPVAQTVQIGDYVNYDAGVWTTADLTKITSSTGSPTLHSTVNDATTGNQALPTTQGQFGGFELGQSRNTNSTEYSTSDKPRTAGWRVWDINSSTGEVTLISAGHSETYYHAYNQSVASMNILKNRNCTMYENAYAKTGSAHILTGQEAATWYNARFGTNYTIIENEINTSTFFSKTFTTDEPISVLENGSYYWLASAYDSNFLYCVFPVSRYVYYRSNAAFGVRVVVSLKSDVLLEQGTGNGSVDNPWKIAQK